MQIKIESRLKKPFPIKDLGYPPSEDQGMTCSLKLKPHKLPFYFKFCGQNYIFIEDVLEL